MTRSYITVSDLSVSWALGFQVVLRLVLNGGVCSVGGMLGRCQWYKFHVLQFLIGCVQCVWLVCVEGWRWPSGGGKGVPSLDMTNHGP